MNLRMIEKHRNSKNNVWKFIIMIKDWIYSRIKKLKKVDLDADNLSIQMTPEQIEAVSNALSTKPCKFLVFGLGMDSKFWQEKNKGKTIFLEDNNKWINQILKKYPQIDARLIKYKTKMKNYENYLQNPGYLEINLPKDIKTTKWDIILVDAPEGYDFQKCPGRMQSIYAASKLIKKKGHVFVHDCNRPVEKLYSDRFLNKKNLKEEIGILRHYVMIH